MSAMQKFRLSYSVLFLAMIGSGCASSLKTVCDEELTQLDQKVEIAQSNIEDFRETESLQRRIANEKSDPSQFWLKLTNEEREEWANWSRDQLQLTQSFIDAAEDPSYAPLRTQLNDTANEWVEFYGYAIVGDAEGMEQSLGKIDGYLAKIKPLTCQYASNPN